MEKENVQCSCEQQGVRSVCKEGFYDAFGKCLVCDHLKECHEDKD